MKFFDILTNISSSTNDISGTSEFDKLYQPYIINRFLASAPGCVSYAEDMNRMPHLPKRLQYLYLLHSIKNKRRYFKYSKKEIKVEKVIMRYFRCREEIALLYKQFLDDEDIKEMKRVFDMP